MPMCYVLVRQVVVALLALACAPSVLVADEFDPNIEIRLFTDDGEPVSAGEAVSGRLTGTVTVRHARGQHARLYENFRVITPREAGHLVDSDPWVRSFELDTTTLYDGENLVSVHVHPMNAPGRPYIADFSVQAVTIVTENDNPSPSGDRRLPTVTIDPSMMLLVDSDLLDSKSLYTDYEAVTVSDDAGRIDVDQDEHRSNRAQVIPHLGASVLGRFRWSDRTLPFAESLGRLIRRAHLVSFQRTEDTPARVVFFVSDASGRASYGFYRFTLPALSKDGRDANPLPSMDARILNVADGDEIVVADDGAFILEVEVTNPRLLSREFPTLSTWVGNRSVAKTNLAPLVRAMGPDETRLTVDVEIPASEIRKLQESRDGGVGSTAFVIWNDFDKFRDANLPASAHVHVNSIRTASHPVESRSRASSK